MSDGFKHSIPESNIAPGGALHLRIEELILHGFAPGDRWKIAAAVEQELRVLLRGRGVPAAWQGSPHMLDGGTIAAAAEAKAASSGVQIARAVYHGRAR